MERFTGESGRDWSYDGADPIVSGGFGTLFATDCGDGHSYVVKVIDFSGSGFSAENFLREVRVGEQLRGAIDEFAVPVIDHKLDGEKLLLVMPRANGSLKDRIETGMTDEERIQALIEISEDLNRLHQLDVIHRDLKPANVLFMDGRWKLADFGISRVVTDQTTTHTWKGFGTLFYTAPELLLPSGVESKKSDLYSFGSLAFEVLTGSPPIVGSDRASVINRILTEVVPDLPATIDPRLKRVVARLLNKNPAARHQDAKALHEELARIQVPAATTDAIRLQELTASREQERAAAAAMKNEQMTTTAAAGARLAQVRGDVAVIIQEGFDSLVLAQPDVEMINPFPAVWVVQGEYGILTITLWPSGDPSSIPSDRPRSRVVNPFQFGVIAQDGIPVDWGTHLLLGQVDGQNDHGRTGMPLANLSCEVVGDRMEWFLYRYSVNPIVSGTGFPERRRFGFAKQQFFDSGVYPYALGSSQPMHTFRSQRSSFVPHDILYLYACAVALPDDL